MQRTLEPELLDHLPPEDVRAIASRRDLARINTVMRQQAIMARRLRALPQPRHLVDLGSGDGLFLLGVARRLSWTGARVTLVDNKDAVSAATRDAFAALGWRCEILTADVFAALAQIDDRPVIAANLFLHHFSDEALRELLALAASHAQALVACEPRRSRFALLASHLVFALGANAVTRHDAVASVRAGFRGAELSALWPQDGWMLDEGLAFPFTHGFTAARDAD